MTFENFFGTEKIKKGEVKVAFAQCTTCKESSLVDYLYG